MYFVSAHWLFNMETMLVWGVNPLIFLHEGHDMSVAIAKIGMMYSQLKVFSPVMDCPHARLAI